MITLNLRVSNAIVAFSQKRGLRYRKPFNVPTAKNKMYRIPPFRGHRDLDEKDLHDKMEREYKAHVSSLASLFRAELSFKETLKVRDKAGEAEADLALLQKNDDWNAQALYEQLLTENRQAEQQEAAHKAQEARKRQEAYFLKQYAEHQVRQLKAMPFVDVKNLEYEIEKMLNETPRNYNFSINAQGEFFKNNLRVDRAQAFDARFHAVKDNPLLPENRERAALLEQQQQEQGQQSTAASAN